MKNIFSKNSRRLIAVERDGFSLRAAVIRTSGNEVLVEQTALSRAVDFSRGLNEVIKAMRQADRKLPNRAILLAPEVLPVLLNLPVDPKKPRPTDQMKEMVRWEMEPYLAQQEATSPIGRIMIGRDYLTSDDVRRVLREMRRQTKTEFKSSAGTRRSPVLFGEVAVGMEVVTRDQLVECLSIQEGLKWGTGDSVYGWLPRNYSTASVPGEEREFSWLACSLSREFRDTWSNAFTRQGLQLQRIYPLAASAAAALDEKALGQPSALLEFQVGLISCVRLRDGGVEEMRFHYETKEQVTSEVYLDLVGHDAEIIYLAGRGASLSETAKGISSDLDREVRCVTVPFWGELFKELPKGMNAESLVGLAGAARHYFRLSRVERTVFVPAHDPPLPVMKRVGIWWVGAACLALLTIGVIEASIALRQWQATTKETEVLKVLIPVEEKIQDINRANEEVSNLKLEITALREEIAGIGLSAKFLERDFPRQRTFALSLLDAVAGALSEEVVIKQIGMTEGDGVKMSGSGLSERAVQEFFQALTVGLEPWNFNVTDLGVLKSGENRYAFDLRLVPKVM